MRFGWTDEQMQLMDMLRRFVGERHDFERRRARLESGDGRKIWSELAELGVLALPFPEECGGIGGTMLDLVIVCEAFGRGLVVEPFIASVVLAGGILRRLPASSDASGEIEAIAAGGRRLALANLEAAGRYNPAWCECRATGDGTGWKIEGRKSMILGGDEADRFVVLARVHGSTDDTAGLGLFMVDANAPDISVRTVRNIDGSGAAELEMRGVHVPLEARLDNGDDAFTLLRAGLDDATIAACAQMCGAVAALNAKTLEYLQERKAFGQSLAQFQAIQHRLVDMKVAEEQCAAITLKAAQSLAEGRASAAHTVAAAKHLVSEEAREVAKHAVQLHGAIGVTDELDISHYFRRIVVLASALGDADYHLARYAARPIEQEAA